MTKGKPPGKDKPSSKGKPPGKDKPSSKGKPLGKGRPFEIAGHVIEPGTKTHFEIPVARMVTQNFVHLPVAVLNGKEPGPVLFLTAAIHGDELNGTEVAREVIVSIDPKRLIGTLIVLPVVNVLGFIQGTRYLPDRRDLNRSFPGSKEGSLASQIAGIVTREVIERSTHGIDLHGGANHRTNLPQIRGTFTDPKIRAMAAAFGAPVAIDAKQRAGSLRGHAMKCGVPTLVYEAGEPMRFEPHAVLTGRKGVQRVMHHLGMVRTATKPTKKTEFVDTSVWHRAKCSGIARVLVKCGQRVMAGQPMAEIGDPFGEVSGVCIAKTEGLVIGTNLNPVVNRGDALIHVAVPKHFD